MIFISTPAAGGSGGVTSVSFSLGNEIKDPGPLVLLPGIPGVIYIPITLNVYPSNDYATSAPFNFGDQLIITTDTLNFGIYMPLPDITVFIGAAGSTGSSLTNSGGFLQQFKPGEGLICKWINSGAVDVSAGKLYCTVVYQYFTDFTP